MSEVKDCASNQKSVVIKSCQIFMAIPTILIGYCFYSWSQYKALALLTSTSLTNFVSLLKLSSYI